MLNRKIIRSKVLQSLYSYFSFNDGKDIVMQKEKELIKNLKRHYQLYLYILCFVEELGNFTRKNHDPKQVKYIPSISDKDNAVTRLFNNHLITILTENELFQIEKEKYLVVWKGDEDLLRKVFLDLKAGESYKDYIHSSSQNLSEDEIFFTYVIKHYTNNFNLLSQHLEEEYPNIWDDKKYVISMAVKSLKKIASDPENPNFLIPVSHDDDIFTFAKELYNKTIEHYDENEAITSTFITKWEPKQIAKIDKLILSMAITEFMHFSSIPPTVTINEYIELAKNYSTINSKNFINGVLDNALKQLTKEKKLNKSERGLFIDKKK